MKRNSKYIGLLYVSPFIIGFLVFYLYPFMSSLYLSFFKYNMINEPTFIGLANYKKMFTADPLFWTSMRQTGIYVFITVPMKLAFALFIAFVLNFKIKGINIFRTVYYIPSILGGSVAVSVMWKYLFADYGLVNTILNLIHLPDVPWFGRPGLALFTVSLLRVWQFGSPMLIFLAALQNIPQSLYEAAMIDGASRMKMFLKVTIPVITPVIFFNFIMQMTKAFQEFAGPYIVTNGGPMRGTFLMVLYIYESAFRKFKMGFGSALSWVLFIVILILTLIVFRSSKYWVFYEDELSGGKKK